LTPKNERNAQACDIAWFHQQCRYNAVPGEREAEQLMNLLKTRLSSLTETTAVVLVLLSLIALPGCKSDSSIDRTAAQKVSDSFMGYVAADRVSEAVGEMEPEIFQNARREQVEAQVRKLFDYCGRPLDSEFKHDEIGFKVYANGRQKPMRKFYYAANTTQHRKGVCFFAIEVVPAQSDLKVTTFGPLMLQSGQLPEWLR
jgi:hypothetical protein